MTKDPIFININLNSKEILYNTFNDNILSEELSDYIYKQCRGEKLNRRINLNIITSFDLNEDEKMQIANLFKNHFSIIACENMIESKMNFYKQILLFIIGIMFIFVAYFVKSVHSYLFSEVFSIFGWVALWELAYNILFVDNQKRIKIKRTKQLEKMKINFL